MRSLAVIDRRASCPGPESAAALASRRGGRSRPARGTHLWGQPWPQWRLISRPDQARATARPSVTALLSVAPLFFT